MAVLPATVDPVRQIDRVADALVAVLEAGLAGIPLSGGLAAINATAPCLKTTRVTTGVFSVRPTTMAAQAVTLVWHDGSRWHARSTRTKGTQRWLEPRWAIETSNGVDVFAATGTGNDVELLRLTDRVTTAGTWTAPTPADLSLVEPGLVLARSFPRTREQQVLLDWTGGTIRERARRIVPTVRGALAEFIDALRAGDRAAARSLAANDAATDTGLKVVGELEGDGPSSFAIDDAETKYWDALPAAARPPSPTTARFVSRRGPWRIVAERGPDDWRVAAIEATPIGDGGPATSAFLDRPTGVAADGAGNVYVAVPFDHRVRRISPAGVITTVAGTGVSGATGDGGPATAARLTAPWAVGVDGRGTLYIADVTAGAVRRVGSDGTISTVASGLDKPTSVAIDSGGALYVTEMGPGRVKRIAPDGSASNVAVGLDEPWSVAVDERGTVYVSERKSGAVRRIVSGSPVGSTTALATLPMPLALTFGAGGDVYAMASGDARVVRIAADGAVTTIAGSGVFGFAGDGGPATAARFHEAFGIAVARGTVYVADTGNGRVRALTPDGTVRTVAGTGLDDIALRLVFGRPDPLEPGVVALVRSGGDVGPARANVVVFDDGRVVQLGGTRYVERRLTPAGLDTLRSDLRETLERSSAPNLAITGFPGVPLGGRGIGYTVVNVALDGREAVVSANPDCCGPPYVPSPYAAHVEARLKRYVDLFASLPAASWVDAAPKPYVVGRFQLIARSQAASAMPANVTVDADGFRWPSSAPITEASGPTCTTVSRAEVAELRRALGRDPQDVDHPDEFVLPWARLNATIAIRLDPIVPGEQICFPFGP